MSIYVSYIEQRVGSYAASAIRSFCSHKRIFVFCAPVPSPDTPRSLFFILFSFFGELAFQQTLISLVRSFGKTSEEKPPPFAESVSRGGDIIPWLADLVPGG